MFFQFPNLVKGQIRAIIDQFLLPILSKRLERHIYQIIYEHILQEDIFPECQWDFLSGKSTTTALLATTDEWHKHLEAGVEIRVVFLDLQKAFDSVPHRNLSIL